MIRPAPRTIGKVLVAGLALIAASLTDAVRVPTIAWAQQAGKVPQIGWLAVGGPGMPSVAVFEQALRERGWVPNENLAIVYRFADKYDRLPVLAAELVRLEPRVIVASPTMGAKAARDATRSIPVVFFGVADPLGEKLVPSFSRPGGNVTGFTGSASFETFAKALQLLKEAVPRARRIAVLRNPANPAAQMKILQETAATLGVELRIVDTRVPEELEPAFRKMVQERADALFIWSDAAYSLHYGRIADLALKHRLPTVCGDQLFAPTAGLMTYSVDRMDAVRRVAGYVDRILKGANPGELPVEQPTQYELVVNLKTAKALGLTIPQSLLLQANRVIQ